MAVGKNKRLSRGKKGSKKKVVDPFTRKEWYTVRAPSMFTQRDVGHVPVNKTAGTKIASDALKGRVYEVCLADLQKDEDQAFRKIKLICQDVQGRQCLTNFYGMDLTTDKAKSLVKKWQSLIEAHIDVKTTDNYTLRMFCIGFTKRRPQQVKKTSYAQTSQIRQIRGKMMAIMKREAEACTLKELVSKFIPNMIGREIEKSCAGIYPLQNVYVRKVKVLKSPKLDITKLLELHEGGQTEVGKKLAESKPVEYENVKAV